MRTFTYDDAGKLLSATETEDNYGTYVYTFTYDTCGNRTAIIKTDSEGTVVESRKYSYNKSNQLVKVELYNGKKTTSVSYAYDADGNLVSETGKDGTDRVNLTYTYTVENRLEAVYDGKELLMAAAYDGDGNRVFQLNYNLHTDEDLKGNSGNGNGNNKDNSGSGNSGKGKKSSTTGNGNATNAEENNSQNQCGILFPIDSEVSDTESYLISLIKTSGKEKNYELIEYVNDVNREYAEVLVEQNINGAPDTAYVYGAAIGTGSDRLSLDRFDGSTGYYLYDPRGSVTGITNEAGQIYRSYRYNAFGEITFGTPQYENEYTYNGESYNPNIESQYLRARYYNVVTAAFLTEDSYLGDITEPLTLNRYNYCLGSPVNYRDKSGHWPIWDYYNTTIFQEFMEIVTYIAQTGELIPTGLVDEKVRKKEADKQKFEDDTENWLMHDKTGQVFSNINCAILSPIMFPAALIRDVHVKVTYGEDRDVLYDTYELSNNIMVGVAGSLYRTGQYLSNPMNGSYDVSYIMLHPTETIFSDPLKTPMAMNDAFWEGENKAPARYLGNVIGDAVQAAIVYETVRACAEWSKNTQPVNSVADDVIEGGSGSNIIEFPSNPEDFNPEGLKKIGPFETKNGKIIKWIDENKKAVFEWDEDLKYGSHYHVIGDDGNTRLPNSSGETHFLPGDTFEK